MNKHLQIKEIRQKGEWETFLLAQTMPPFLQSWNSKVMDEHFGHQNRPLGLYEDGTLAGVCLIRLIRPEPGSYLYALYGPTYLYAPYGPIMKEWRSEYLQCFVDELTAYGKREGFHFIRFAPFVADSPEIRRVFAACGFRVSPIHMLAETMWLLDIRATDDVLLKGMRNTTRGRLRRAMKEQVDVQMSTEPKAVEEFIDLHKTTEQRHHFVAYPSELFHQEVGIFAADNQAAVFHARHQNRLIASAIIVFYGPAAFYHHGASIPSKIPAATLLQWQAIQEAKKRGCSYYSFWGITESENEKHPFYGPSLFKRGFGGSAIHLLPCQDLPLSLRYRVTQSIETVRRIRRGFGLKRS